MLQQKQYVADFLLFAQVDKLLLQGERLRVVDAAEMEQMQQVRHHIVLAEMRWARNFSRT